MNRTLIVLTFILSFSSLFAQSPKPESTLLWRISGNGLQKPSYLYGTMHVRDKRVFNFADSVLLKLDECEAFSLEIDLDSAYYQMISDRFSNNDFKLRNYLGEEEYNEIQRELAEDSGFDPSLFKNQNPFVLRYFVNRPGNLRNDMPNFLDAHLYKIARENGKKLVALENVRDHTKTLTELPKAMATKVVKAELGLNKMKTEKDLLTIYVAADLEEIDRNSRKMSDSAYSIMFTLRNHNMCTRINEYAPKHSTFFAVGAGHLPGEEGLISLLRKKGYTVTPIMPTYRGLAGKYKSKKLERPWNNVSIPEEGYAVDMPSRLLATYEAQGTIKACIDAGTGLFYMCASVVLPENASIADDAEKTRKFIENYWKKQSMEILEKRTVMTSGKPEKEFLVKKNGHYFRTRLYFHDTYTYLLLVGGSLQSIEQEDANRFFKSIRFLPIKPNNWNVYKSHVGAYSVYFPGSPKESEVKVPTDDDKVLLNRMILANDATSGIQYAMQYFDGKGLMFPDDSSFLFTTTEAMREDLKEDSFVVRKKEINGFPGLECITYGQNQTIMKTFICLRGSRAYNLIAVLPSTKLSDPNLESFFNSFQFTEYQDSTWENHALFNTTVSLEFPSAPEFTTEKETYSAMFDSTHQYLAQDKFSGNSYYFVKSYFQKYFSAPSYDSIFNQASKEYLNFNDTVVSKNRFTIGNMPGMDVFAENKQSHNYRQIRMYLSDSALYYAFSYIPKNYRNSNLSDRFYESIVFEGKNEPAHHLNKKTSKLFEDLKSSDSATHYYAVSRINSLSIEKQDIQNLYKALASSYISDSMEYGGARSKLFGILKPVGDSSYLEFFRSHYADYSGNPNLQVDALEVLSKLTTTEARKLLFQTLFEKAPDAYSYTLFWGLRDSMELNIPYFPEILKLLPLENYTENVLDLTENMLKEKLIAPETISSYFPQLYSEADKQLKNIKEYKNTEYFSETLINILSRISTDESFDKLQLYLASPNINLKLYAAIGLLKKGVKVPSKELEKIASFPGYRSQLYTELDTLGKKTLFPARYFTQEYFAESDIWNYFSYDDGEPTKLELKSTVERNYKGEMKRFYCYKATFDSDDEKYCYFAVSGPYPLNGKEVITSGELTGSSYNDFDEKTIEEHLEEYLEE